MYSVNLYKSFASSDLVPPTYGLVAQCLYNYTAIPEINLNELTLTITITILM
jgi:hypothetical protein